MLGNTGSRLRDEEYGAGSSLRSVPRTNPHGGREGSRSAQMKLVIIKISNGWTGSSGVGWPNG